jgi:predicted MFS family arabinose efflux permease
MSRTARGVVPAPGSWLSIGIIYLYGVSTTASLSKIIPVLGDIGVHLGATTAQAALLISLVGVLPALMASVAGSIVDRIGAHRALQLVALIGIGVNTAYLAVGSLGGFMTIRVFEGMIAIGAYSAAPALIMATASDARRGRAMAVWSTYTPVGFSLGLALGGAFAGTANWRGGYLVHLILFVALLCTSWLLPRMPAAVVAARRATGLLAAWGERGPLRLALSFAILVLIGFGMSNVYPEWYSRQHGVGAGPASNILALINLAMIPAGFMAGTLVARGWRDSHLLTGLLLATMVISVPLFQPGLAEPVRQATMFVWMLVQGATIAVVTAALPRVVADPRQGAAAAGLLSQLAALTTFITPLIWQPILQSGQWVGFVAVTVAAAALIWVLFPRPSR